jgi:hypothetical protein
MGGFEIGFYLDPAERDTVGRSAVTRRTRRREMETECAARMNLLPIEARVAPEAATTVKSLCVRVVPMASEM